MKHLKTLLVAACLALAGCSNMAGAAKIVRGANDVLEVLCESRPALDVAQRALESGDVGAAVDILKGYLVEHKDDREVAALLTLLEEQVAKLAKDNFGI